MNGHLIQAIKMAPRKQWEDFFDERITQQAMRIVGTENTDLVSLKETVKGLQALKNEFLEAYDTKITPAQSEG